VTNNTVHSWHITDRFTSKWWQWYRQDNILVCKKSACDAPQASSRCALPSTSDTEDIALWHAASHAIIASPEVWNGVGKRRRRDLYMTMNQTSDVTTIQMTTAMTMTPAVVKVSLDDVPVPLSLTTRSSADTTSSRHVCNSHTFHSGTSLTQQPQRTAE